MKINSYAFRHTQTDFHFNASFVIGFLRPYFCRTAFETTALSNNRTCASRFFYNLKKFRQDFKWVGYPKRRDCVGYPTKNKLRPSGWKHRFGAFSLSQQRNEHKIIVKKLFP